MTRLRTPLILLLLSAALLGACTDRAPASPPAVQLLSDVDEQLDSDAHPAEDQD